MSDKNPQTSESTPVAASTPAAAPAATNPTPASSTPSSASAAPATSEHPLETAWTFYFDRKLSREAQAAAGFTNYAQNLQKVGKFNSIEGFWHHYSFMQQPDQIPRDHNLYLFRDDHIPAWESFPNGSSWIIKVRKGNGVISRLWEELCFACVGEWFEDPDVVGVTLATRAKDDNISVWLKSSLNTKVGEKLKDLLNLDESTIMHYQSFAKAQEVGSSFRGAQEFAYAPAVVPPPAATQ